MNHKNRLSPEVAQAFQECEKALLKSIGKIKQEKQDLERRIISQESHNEDPCSLLIWRVLFFLFLVFLGTTAIVIVMVITLLMP